jgi:hypothetical protein
MKMKNFQMLMMGQADQEVEKKIIHVEIKNQVQEKINKDMKIH